MLTELSSRYRVLSTLGEGGMGVVYLVEDAASGEKLALKVLSGQAGLDENQLLQFKQEFRLMARLKHPNTCNVFDFGVLQNGTPYFTMEYVPGQELLELIPLAPEQALQILGQLGAALGFIHQQGFVHCDLKPENIRLTPDGTVKLMDFGLMEVAGHASGGIKGTLAYMSPEAAKGDRLDARSDLYSLGAVAYHLLAGGAPFKGKSPIDVLRAHLNLTPRPLVEAAPGVPDALANVVMKLLAKEPTSRYPSAADMLLALGLEATEGLGASLLASSFVGREEPLVHLQEGLRAMRRDAVSQTLWVVGEPGCGKTRLLSEFRFGVQLDEIPLLRGQCPEPQAPYGPFVQVLRSLIPTARANFPHELARHAQVLDRLVPELIEGAAPSALEPEQERILIQGGLCELICKAAAQAGGAVLVLEDWERADSLSKEALAYLQRNQGATPLLIVGSSTSGEGLPGTVLELGALTTPESSAMIGSMLGVTALPAGFVEGVLHAAGGHPQRIINVLEHLLRTGVLGKARGVWQVPDALGASELPADLADLLVERFLALSPEAKRVGELAAVIGQAADLELLKALAGLEEAALFDALDELLQHQVLVSEEKRYAFALGSLKDSIYGRQPIEVRQRTHAAVAAHLEARLDDGDDADRASLVALAWQYLRSTEHEKAVRYGFRAALRNLEVLAGTPAWDLLEAGLAHFEALPENEEWGHLRAEYHFRLAMAAGFMENLAVMGEQLNVAIARAEQLGDRDSGTGGGRRVLLEALALAGQHRARTFTPAAQNEGVALMDRAVPLAQEQGRLDTAARCMTQKGRLQFFLGNYAEAIGTLEAAARQAEAAELPFYYARSLNLLGYLRTVVGRESREQGLRDMAEALAIQERIADKYGLSYTCMVLSSAQIHTGRLQEAEQSILKQLKIVEEMGVTDDRIAALLNLGTVYMELGRFDDALTFCNRALELANKFNHRFGQSIAPAILALVLAHKGELRRAAELARKGEKLGQESSQYLFSCILPFLMDTYLRLGLTTDANRLAQEAHFLLRGSKNEELETAVLGVEAEILARGDDPDKALAGAERYLQAALSADASVALVKAVKLKARLALERNQPDEAQRFGEQALAKAEQLGCLGLAGESAGIVGEAASVRGLPEALGLFQRMQAIADQINAPVIRAQALFGQGTANPELTQAASKVVEAQKLLKGLAADLPEEDRQAFYALPECEKILSKNLAVQENVSADNSQMVYERLQSVSQDLMSVASQYGALFKDWATSNKQLQMLNSLARQINETLVLEDVLPQVLKLTLELTNAERGFLLLRESEGEQLLVKAAFDRYDRSIINERCSLSVCQKVVASGQAVTVLDASLDDDFKESKSIANLNLRTLMCVPLQSKGRTLGVLYVDSQAVVATFTEKDLELLQAIASHAAVAIENAMLYHDLNRRAVELEAALEAYRRADKDANTDMLTGLANRRFFEKQGAIHIETSRRYQRDLSVIVLDVDFFKKFNDTYGHAIGDEVLKVLGRVLPECVRLADIPARFGGEEFVVLCPETDGDGTGTVAERIRQAIMAVELKDLDGNPVRQITVSSGIATLRPGDKSVADIVERADAALYASKRNGRNQWTVWTEGLVVEEEVKH